MVNLVLLERAEHQIIILVLLVHLGQAGPQILLLGLQVLLEPQDQMGLLELQVLLVHLDLLDQMVLMGLLALWDLLVLLGQVVL
jgi:hypothetical protein